jgi:hypothetical protein
MSVTKVPVNSRQKNNYPARRVVVNDEDESWRIVPEGKGTGNLSKDLALKFATAPVP